MKVTISNDNGEVYAITTAVRPSNESGLLGYSWWLKDEATEDWHLLDELLDAAAKWEEASR